MKIMHRLWIYTSFILVMSTATVRAQDTTRLSLLFLGDIMQHDSQIAAAYDAMTGTYDYAPCFEPVAPILKSADLTIGNLELTTAGPPYKGYPQFSAPDNLVETLKSAGVDIFVTANNHCVDRGRKGLERTITVLDTLAIPHTGTFLDSMHRESNYPLLIEKNGFSFSLLNYTYGTNGINVPSPNIVNLIDTVQMSRDLIKASLQQPDFIVVFFHWGSEYQAQPNKIQRSLTEFCFRKGVKLVIGSHPHVLQPMEWRKEEDQLVAYSLGNFVSGQRVRYRDGGAMLHVEIRKVTTDSVSVSIIERAGYDLQYVYRDANKKYFVLPVKEFEADTVKVREVMARDQLKEFASDSRALLGKYNLNIPEWEERVVVSDTAFYISFNTISTVVDSLVRNEEILQFYGIIHENTDEGTTYFIGEFFEESIAHAALHDIEKRTSFDNLKIVRRRRLESGKGQ